MAENKQILIVEDNVDHAELARLALAEKGKEVYEVAVATNTEACLERFTKEHYDAVILDYSLGEEDGLVLLKRIKALSKDIPIIMVTGLGNERIAVEAIKLGAYDYIVKSTDYLDVMVAVVERALEAYENILGRKKAEEALHESEYRYRLLVETMSDGLVVIKSEEGLITYVNERLCEIVGYSQTEMVGKSLFYFFDEDNKKVLKEQIKQKEQRVSEPYEIVWTTKQGRNIITLVSPRVIFGKDGSFQGSFSVVTDITERKEMQREVQKIRSLESIGILAGGIAHDFNNILAELLGNVQLSEIKIRKNKDAIPYLKSIEGAIKKAANLTQQLLTFSKGGAPIRKTASIAELLEETITFALRGSNVKSNFSLAKNLWPADIDKGQISQVINNLVINADQAMPGGGAIKISAENHTANHKNKLSLKPGEYIKITIKDEGIGIPTEHIGSIFNPYFTTKQKGSGLGLAISYSIIKRHHGQIRVESKIGEGTTFYIYLLASSKKLIAEEKEEEVVKEAGRILFMDDEEKIREVIGEMLEDVGYRVALVAEGTEAVEKYKEAEQSNEPFDVVMLDLTIPGGMGGKETLNELLKINPQVKAVVTSGYYNDSLLSDYKGHGFKAVIAKPYKIEELSEILHQVRQ